MNTHYIVGFDGPIYRARSGNFVYEEDSDESIYEERFNEGHDKGYDKGYDSGQKDGTILEKI